MSYVLLIVFSKYQNESMIDWIVFTPQVGTLDNVPLDKHGTIKDLKNKIIEITGTRDKIQLFMVDELPGTN